MAQNKKKKQSNHRSCDVLIIGGGSAGLRAAIEAHDAGASVLIISKSERGDPHTILARGGINAALGTMDPEDNWMIHASDTLREGEFLADYERVEVLGIDIEKKEIVIFECKSLILAAGGYTRVYSVSSSRIFENYGEGMTLAYEAGVDLVDMEMVQFHPTGMVWPEKALGTLATEAIRGEGGILLNSKGERFMKNYDPERMELGPRDVVARANYNEIISGRGTEHGGVWLDVTHLRKEVIQERLTTMYEQFQKLDGIDISKEKMEVGPTAHYSMGGVVVDINCRTSVKGLFAVGEVISQIHGANRLGGNSLLDTLVFGKIAGNEAAKLALQQRKVNTEKAKEVSTEPKSGLVNQKNT